MVERQGIRNAAGAIRVNNPANATEEFSALVKRSRCSIFKLPWMAVMVLSSIPVCAGEPRLCAPKPERRGGYPRLCGGTSVGVSGQTITKGYPRLYGEPPPLPELCPRSPVYPRLCGGTPSSVKELTTAGGLSPPVRGNHAQVSRALRYHGSIPACAGEPPSPGSTCRPMMVYPRLCGGTTGTTAFLERTYGLSPPVRGNHPAPPFRRPVCRSIPACAGEPFILYIIRGGNGVYPRLCGGTGVTRQYRVQARGLSPPVRGNPGRS